MDAQAHDWQVVTAASVKLNQWLGFVGGRKNDLFFLHFFLFKWQIILHSSIDAEIESEQSLA